MAMATYQYWLGHLLQLGRKAALLYNWNKSATKRFRSSQMKERRNFFVCVQLVLVYSLNYFITLLINPPVSKACREVANLTWRKNPHTPVYGVKEFVFLSVTNFDLNYLRTGKIEWAKILFRISLSKRVVQKIFFSRQGASMAWAEGWKANYAVSFGQILDVKDWLKETCTTHSYLFNHPSHNFMHSVNYINW